MNKIKFTAKNNAKEKSSNKQLFGVIGTVSVLLLSLIALKIYQTNEVGDIEVVPGILIINNNNNNNKY